MSGLSGLQTQILFGSGKEPGSAGQAAAFQVLVVGLGLGIKITSNLWHIQL